jgi:hypothetical protein
MLVLTSKHCQKNPGQNLGIFKSDLQGIDQGPKMVTHDHPGISGALQ